MAKKVSLYGIMAALCMALSYIEHLISFDFIAPGVKLGVSNAVALLLISKGDIKGAFSVNIVRIMLSALLFSGPFTLVYSLSGGIVSLVGMSIFSKLKSISVIGFSILGALLHNITQLAVAVLLLGRGVWYYIPILILSAAISGFLTGCVAKLILNSKIFKIKYY